MNIETQTMDPRIARVHFIDYKKRVKEHQKEREAKLAAMKEEGKPLWEQRELRKKRTVLEREDEQLMAAYKAMALGEKILNIHTVLLRSGTLGREQQFLPKLAIARADWLTCFFEADGRKVRYASCQWPRESKRELIDLPHTVMPAESWNNEWRKGQGFGQYPARAIVPSIPSYLRPSGDLNEFFILWEAAWQMKPPVDPLLLKHVHGPIYTALCQWDLTVLERSILEGRLS